MSNSFDKRKEKSSKDEAYDPTSLSPLPITGISHSTRGTPFRSLPSPTLPALSPTQLTNQTAPPKLRPRPLHRNNPPKTRLHLRRPPPRPHQPPKALPALHRSLNLPTPRHALPSKLPRKMVHQPQHQRQLHLPTVKRLRTRHTRQPHLSNRDPTRGPETRSVRVRVRVVSCAAGRAVYREVAAAE